MGGETVVDYALRFKRQWGPGTWVLGYTDDIVYEAGGNPYGTSWPAGFPSTMPDELPAWCTWLIRATSG